MHKPELREYEVEGYFSVGGVEVFGEMTYEAKTPNKAVRKARIDGLNLENKFSIKELM